MNAPELDRSFVDRRKADRGSTGGSDRRQFANSHGELTPEARELALAIDNYKLTNRRRYINYEEMLAVIKGLGYSKAELVDAIR